MEEAAKAVILELANLQLVGENVIKKSMKNHSPKQVMLVGLEQSKIFLDKKLVGEVTDYVVEDEQALRLLEKPLREDIQNLEKQKQNGLYVDVDSKSGQITSSPNYVGRNDTKVRVSVGRAQKNLLLARALVNALRDFRLASKRGTTICNLRILGLGEVQPYYAGDQPDQCLTIVFDEI
jgi:AbiV family abortive infection protein